MGLILVHNNFGLDVVHHETCPHIVNRPNVGSRITSTAVPQSAVACSLCKAKPWRTHKYVPERPREPWILNTREAPPPRPVHPRTCQLIDGLLVPVACPDCGEPEPRRVGSQWSCDCGWRGQPSGAWHRLDRPVLVEHVHDDARRRATEDTIGKLGGFDSALAPRRRSS